MPEPRDLVVIGAGPGGVAAATAARAAGREVTLVTDGVLGGALAEWAPAPDHRFGEPELTELGIDVVRGRGAFLSSSALRVQRADLPSLIVEFDSCVVATGTHGEQNTAYTDAECDRGEAVEVRGTGMPALHAIAQLLRAGSTLVLGDVTALLVREFPRAAERALWDWLGDRVLVRDRDAGARGAVEATKCIDVRRRPGTTGLGLERAGVTVDADGGVVVDETLLAAPRIAAIGDVVPGVATPQRAVAQARAAIATLSGERTVWSGPVACAAAIDDGSSRFEIAAVGSGFDASAELEAARPTDSVRAERGDSGWIELVNDRRTRVLLGAWASGRDAAAFIAGIAVAVEAGLLVDDVIHTALPWQTVARWRELPTDRRGRS
ncbi:FAD-dependent oxidoreductase [Herbiconiux moechotypicola]|nr:FAD-dependent oxidoreductase [Herbiconiux moechotypicola]MCS5729282.1 FAD-dependent oxidoreductase [Herbiconiux moechotypicola]